MVPGDDRPPFVTFNKEGGFYISPEKEQRFQVNLIIQLKLLRNVNLWVRNCVNPAS